MASLEALSARTGEAKKALVAFGLILVLGLAAYSNSFHGSFQFDDFHQITKNQNIRTLTNAPRFFTDAGMGSYYTDLKGYRPVTYLSFAINYAADGYNTYGYHLLNFILHLLSAFFVYMVTRLVLRQAGYADPFLVALAASLVFALHPIQTGAVSYVSGRAAILAALFCLSSFYAFLRLRAAGGGSGWRGLSWAILSSILFGLALLSKENASALLLIIVAYDVIFTMPDRGGVRISAGALLYALPYAAVFGAYLAARRLASGFFTKSGEDYGVLQYMMSEAKALMLYIRLMFLPINQNADYDLHATMSVDLGVVAAALLILVMLYLLYRLGSKNPVAAFFGFWFFIALVPESSIIPITDIAVEYRLYLPSVGFIVAAVVLADGLLKRREVLKKLLVLPLIAMLLVLTFSRNTVWATELSLWSDTVKKVPNSARAHANLGNAMMLGKRYMEGIFEFNRSLEINPFYTESYNVYNNLGICLFESGMKEEAIEQYRRALTVQPGYMEAYGNLGAAYFKMGRYYDAVETLTKAVVLDPSYSPCHLILAKTYTKLGRHKDALAEVRLAAGYSPRDFETRYNLAVMLYNNKLYAEALEQARTAAGLAGDDSQRADAEELLRGLKG